MKKINKTIRIDPDLWEYVKKTGKAMGLIMERRVADLLEAGLRSEGQGREGS